MDQVLVALTNLIAHPDARPFPARAEIIVDLAAAPESVVALAQAMATHYHNLEVGEFRMYAGTPRTVMSLAEMIEMSDIPLDELAADVQIDPEATLHLGADAGGMSALGVHWTEDGQVSFVVVEMDDPIPENLIQRFTTPAALLAFLERRDEVVVDKLRAVLLG